MIEMPKYSQLYIAVTEILSRNPRGITIDRLEREVAEILNLTEEQLTTPHRNDPRTEYQYRLAWARTHLKRAGIAYNENRGIWRLTRSEEGDNQLDRRLTALIETERPNAATSAMPPEPLPYRRDPLPPLPQPAAEALPASCDFFVSYSHVDEVMAREVVDTVEGLGLSAFAQFRDMGPGANFVREMQRGLAASARLIALYSPEYEASHQCQAEWSAAYNADPSGEQRKLLPFLLRPTRLNPLAQQVVYKSLVGLSTAARRAAIIEAIEHRKQTTVVKAAAAELAAAASPDVVVTAAGRIDTAPNAIFDQAVVTSDLSTLPIRQRTLCQKIIRHVPANTPAMFTGCFKTYGKHLGEPVATLIPGLLDDQWQMARAYLAGREPIEFDAGMTKTLELFAQNHSEIITHFPLREERERLLAKTPIDEQAATGEALSDPIESVKQAVEAAAEAGQVTSAVVDHVGNLADRAEALAAPVTPVSNEPTNAISPRRRLVLTSLGFFERLYAAIGSTASVLSTDTGRALYNAAREAADALMRFIK
ncbi:MAG TPA: TIR domain-containing protein [Bosea sp. (in: a-proteobacteria)]